MLPSGSKVVDGLECGGNCHQSPSHGPEPMLRWIGWNITRWGCIEDEKGGGCARHKEPSIYLPQEVEGLVLAFSEKSRYENED